MRRSVVARTITLLMAVYGTAVAITVAAAPSGPPIYVSSLTGEQILRIDGTTGVVTVLFTGSTGFRPGDLTVGPDNKVYACAGDRVIRMDQDGRNVETVYDKATSPTSNPPSAPEGPRFTWDGSLLLNTRATHTGVWLIPGVATIAAGGPFPAPLQVLSASATGSTRGEGLAIAPNGDLLIVDRASNRVLISRYESPSPYRSAGVLIQNPAGSAPPTIDSPVGIAVNSRGEIFVANGGSLNNIARFGASGSPMGTYASFAPDRPLFLEFTSNDDLFVATASSSLLNGKLWRVPPTGDSPALLAALPKRKGAFPPADGVAVPATSKTIDKSFAGSWPYNFGSHVCQLDAGACSATCSAVQKSPAEIRSLLQASSIHAKPLPYLGEEGFVTTYDLSAAAAACSPASSGSFGISIGSLIPEGDSINPRIVRCESGAGPCTVRTVDAWYPIADFIPGDGLIKVTTNNFSEYFLVDLALDPARTAGFCGFLSPFDAASGKVFNTTQTLAVKFRLSKSGCSGAFVSDATALLSVARIAPDFATMNPLPSGSSNDRPLFRFDPVEQTYIYNLSLKGYLPGAYNLTVVFLSSDAYAQSVRFTVVP